MNKFSLILILLSFSLYSKDKELIAVLPFSSQGIEEKELLIIADSLINELSKSEKYDVMERSVVEKQLKSKGIDNLYTCDELACALVFGEFLSLKYLIQGRLSKIEDTYTFSLRFINTETEVIIDDFTEFFTGNFESLLTKIVPKLSKKIQKIRIRQWRVEKKTIKKIEEALMEDDEPIEKKLKVSSVSTSTTLAPEIEIKNDIPEAKPELIVSPQEKTIDNKEERRKRRKREEMVEKQVEEESNIWVSSVSTSTTLAPSIEPEKEISVSTSTTLAPSIEFEKETPESELSESPQEETEKPEAENIPTLVLPESTTPPLSMQRDNEEEVKPDSVFVQQQYSKNKEEEEKDVLTFTSKAPSEIPSTVSIEDKDKNNEIDLFSDDKSASPSLVKDSEKESEELVQSKEEALMSDEADKTLIPDIENESPEEALISNEVDKTLIPDIENESPEEALISNEVDKTLIPDIENESPANVNELQEKDSHKKQNAIIITSGISAAVAIPVFIMLFSKREEKKPNNFSLTVEWP